MKTTVIAATVIHLTAVNIMNRNMEQVVSCSHHQAAMSVVATQVHKHHNPMVQICTLELQLLDFIGINNNRDLMNNQCITKLITEILLFQLLIVNIHILSIGVLGFW